MLARVAELEARLRRVTAERDEALASVERLRAATGAAWSEPGVLDKDACQACDGEGYYWVHDFRMDCRRCGGTGRVERR